VPIASGEPLPRSISRVVGGNPIQCRRARRSSLDPRRWLNATSIGTGNVLVRTKLFEEIGPFSESLRRGEDMEFFLRAYRQGAAIALAPNAIIYHIVSDERLAPEMLLGAATRGGLVRAEVELSVFGVP